MYTGFEDGAAFFRFSGFKSCQKQEKPLLWPYDRYQTFFDQCASGEEGEEHKLLMLDELFKQGRLNADQTLDALRGGPS